MKFRTGFVSNSSSSSFAIPLIHISARQLKLIQAHRTKAREYGMSCPESDEWDITVTEHEVRGFTCMDNFNMHGFLDAIGVPGKHVTWSEFPIWDD